MTGDAEKSRHEKELEGGVMGKILFVVAASFALMFLPAAHGASGGTIVVDNDFADCPNADTASIQAGITMAAAGDIVLVCHGTYAESVTIDAAHNDISVKAKGPLGDVVLAGSGAAQPYGFGLIGAHDVLIEGFVVQNYHDDIVLSGASDNIVRGNETMFAAEHDGIELVSNSHRNLVEHNVAHDNLHNTSCGISAGGGSSDNVIRKNVVFHNANNGILLGGGLLGAAGPGNVIERNLVFDNGEPVSGANRGTGILNAISPGSVIQHNEVTSNNAFGIRVLGATSVGVTVAHNFVASNGSTNDDDGIRIELAPNAVVQLNRSRLNRHDGVHLVAATGALVADNLLVDNGTPGVGNGCGIDVDSLTVAGVTTPSTGNTVTNNVASGHTRAGIRIRNSLSNTVENNQLKDNPGDGILLTNGDNNSVDRNGSNQNGTGATHAGIHADAASSGNLLTDNHAFQNVTFDARDDNANTWSGNHCGTDFPAGTICENG
jgi:parallel beta-helix repeat protein